MAIGRGASPRTDAPRNTNKLGLSTRREAVDTPSAVDRGTEPYEPRMKVRRSVLNWSLRIPGVPCGAPG
jgi:hypothetical protein